MKTIDILNLLLAFNRVYADESLTNPEKIAIGNEVLILLPLPQFAPAIKASVDATYRSISARVDALEALNATTEARRAEGKKEPSKPLRKTSANA